MRSCTSRSRPKAAASWTLDPWALRSVRRQSSSGTVVRHLHYRTPGRRRPGQRRGWRSDQHRELQRRQGQSYQARANLAEATPADHVHLRSSTAAGRYKTLSRPAQGCVPGRVRPPGRLEGPLPPRPAPARTPPDPRRPGPRRRHHLPGRRHARLPLLRPRPRQWLPVDHLPRIRRPGNHPSCTQAWLGIDGPLCYFVRKVCVCPWPCLAVRTSPGSGPVLRGGVRVPPAPF